MTAGCVLQKKSQIKCFLLLKWYQIQILNARNVQVLYIFMDFDWILCAVSITKPALTFWWFNLIAVLDVLMMECDVKKK